MSIALFLKNNQPCDANPVVGLAAQESGGQTAPAFEVASVHLATDESIRFDGPRLQISHGTLTTHALTLRECLQWAYQMQSSQISGPDWIDNVRLDIVAKAASVAGSEIANQQLFQMLRALLTKRMGIKAHVERKQMTVDVMTPAKGGVKFTESTTEGPRMMDRDKNGVEHYQRYSMFQFTSDISHILGVPVMNETGLNGLFDFQLDIAAVPVDPRQSDRATWQIAALQQLGIKVQERKDQVDVLVIDHAEKAPTEN